MAIAYLPSEGNIDKVSITSDVIWHGASIGGALISKIKTNAEENDGNYYSYAYGNLGASSRWFYKDVTDYNFINGVTIYRCMYIGSDERYSDNEVLGTISSSITHDGPPAVNGSVSVDLFADGVYTAHTSKNTLCIYDEDDSTGLLSSATWSPSITHNSVLAPGQYLKVWVRLQFVQNPSLLQYTNYDYYLTIKDLTIPISRIVGRLSLARIFTATITENSGDIEFEQSIPQDFNISNIFKIIEHNGLTNIFYFYQDKLKLLIVQKDKAIDDNKYVDIDISSVLPDITAAQDNILSNFSVCYSNSVSGTDSSIVGVSGVGTSGINEYPDNNLNYDSLLGANFISDVFGSDKPSNNRFYLFYNKFLSDTSEDYVEKYGHRNYYWASYVLHINLDFINSNFFTFVDPGIANTKSVSIADQTSILIRDRFYTNTIAHQDDLFTLIGYVPEDCRVTNNVSKMIYLWEGDINSNDINSQECDIPKVNNSTVHTITNKCPSETYLSFDETLASDLKFDYVRSLEVLDTAEEAVNMGPPTQKIFNHGYSKVSYDITQDVDQFSTSWGFTVDADSVAVNTPSPTGVETSGTSGVDISGGPCYFDSMNPLHMHLVLQSIYDSAKDLIDPAGCEVDTVVYEDSFKEIFRIHCRGNEEQTAVKALYNFYSRKWNIVINNEVGQPLTFQFATNPLSTTSVNVITVNTFRKLDFGCAKKYTLQYSIHVNGTELVNGMSYTHDTSDSYVVTHNTLSDFSGSLTYWELRDYISPLEAEKYAEAVYRIHANIAWAKLEPEMSNTTTSKYSNFSAKRNILITNLNYDSNETILFPIVLQGTGYNISSVFNEEVRRSIFNFSKIDIYNKTFAFTLEGTNTELEWHADSFNVDRDTLTIWIRLSQWTGQRITMYYSDMNIIKEAKSTSAFDDFYAVWMMDSVKIINQKRHTVQKIFSSGESFVYTEEGNGIRSLVEITKQTPFGVTQMYKSNKFNVEWDDSNQGVDNTDAMNEFIKSEIRKIKPAYMEVNKITSKYPYKLESNNNHKSSDGVTSD
jgi:hypothetical protein